MSDKNNPLVSIGVPVFNGENGLARALDSLIEQDYPNLEIIISDNGSTDTTPQICEEYVQKDSRVQYSRLDENMGAIVNFNRVFELSCGEYFMWASHDDYRERSFVSACVEKMKQCPQAVCCHVRTAISIAGRDEKLCTVHLDSFEGVTELVERYRETLKIIPATVVYGLYRSSAIQNIRLFQKIIAADIGFNQALSIYGEFVQVPRVLLNVFGREKWNTINQDYFVFFGKKKKPWWYWPFVVVFCDHWSRVAGSNIPLRLKLRLWGILIEHEVGQVVLKILIKTAGLLCPEIWKLKLGCAIYWRWMHNPNIQVDNPDFYVEKVIKPKLGWWR